MTVIAWLQKVLKVFAQIFIRCGEALNPLISHAGERQAFPDRQPAAFCKFISQMARVKESIMHVEGLEVYHIFKKTFAKARGP